MFVARHIASRARRDVFRPRRSVSESAALVSGVRQHIGVAGARVCVALDTPAFRVVRMASAHDALVSRVRRVCVTVAETPRRGRDTPVFLPAHTVSGPDARVSCVRQHTGVAGAWVCCAPDTPAFSPCACVLRCDTPASRARCTCVTVAETPRQGRDARVFLRRGVLRACVTPAAAGTQTRWGPAGRQTLPMRSAAPAGAGNHHTRVPVAALVPSLPPATLALPLPGQESPLQQRALQLA
jgi:hypothetical protein